MSVVHEPYKPMDFVERVFESADWNENQQMHLRSMADELTLRIGEHRVESAAVHIFEKSAGKVTVKMVAGPE
jgi:hypothetical protein